MVERELSQKANLLIYWLTSFFPTLTYGHEIQVMTKGMRSWVQLAEMSFLQIVVGLSLRDRVRSSSIWRELGVESSLLSIEKSQLRRYGHLIRMPPSRLPLQVFQIHPVGRKPQERCRTQRRDYSFWPRIISGSPGEAGECRWGEG